MPRLQEKYKKVVVPALQKEFGYKNVMAIPKIEKVVINVGVGKITKDDKAIKNIVETLKNITGQQPSLRKARKSIAGFKLREGSVVGIAVTLRGSRMYDFIDRLISIALPRSRDFRGIDLKNFDSTGSLNIGIKESTIFPDARYESLKDVFGLQVTVKTTSKKKEEGILLLRLIGFPLTS